MARDASYRAANAALVQRTRHFWVIKTPLYANQVRKVPPLYTDARPGYNGKNLKKLDMTAFNACIKQRKYASVINNDVPGPDAGH